MLKSMNIASPLPDPLQFRMRVMASLGTRHRHGRTYYTIRTRAGQELAAGWNKDTARTILAKYETDERLAAHGIQPTGRSAWTLQQLSEWDLAQTELAGGETASRERRWAVILDRLGADSRIQTLTAADVEKFTRKRLAEGTTHATINRDRALLRVALARARNPASLSGYAGDPFAGTRPLEERRQRKTPKALPPTVINDLINECWRLAVNSPPYVDAYEWHQNAVMIELSYLTASRLTQVTHMKWSQVSGGKLTFAGHKRGIPRSFKLRGRLKALLDPLPRVNEWVFPSARSLGPRHNFRKFWKTACKNLGLPGITHHTLRHSASSTAFSRGAMIPDVQRLLGHTSPAMAIRLYTQLFPEDSRVVSPSAVPKRPPKTHRT